MELRRLPTVRGMVDSTIDSATWNETILIARLDWIWPQICGHQDRVDGIKIDVQGMEIEVLQGMAGLLKSFKSKLVVEIHHGVNRNELLDLVEQLAYSRRGIPIEPTTREEVDPLYVDDRSYAFKAL